MSIRAISNLIVMWASGLTLHLFCHATQVSPASQAPLPNPVIASPLISEKLLIGEYFNGGGFGGHYLELEPDHRFSYCLRVCMGVTRNQGTWQLQGGIIVLHPEDRTSIGHESLDLRFIPVTWENKLYLVDENEMPSFCHDLFLKAPYDISGHYERKQSVVKKTSFEIPERFRDFVEQGEIVTRAASVDDDGIVTLEGAGVTRLKPGMHLCWRESEGGWKRELRVIEVQQGYARARQISLHEKSEDRVRPYDLFTTGTGYTSPAGTGKTYE